MVHLLTHYPLNGTGRFGGACGRRCQIHILCVAAMRAVATNSVAAYLARLAAGSKHGWLCVLLLFIIYFILIFYDCCQTSYLKIYRDQSSRNFQLW